MSTLVRFAAASAILLGSLILFPPFSFGKPDYMKKEGKACTHCHNAPNKRDLNAVGKCYAEHNHSLENCNKKVAAAER
jgi:hypothetical protein